MGKTDRRSEGKMKQAIILICMVLAACGGGDPEPEESQTPTEHIPTNVKTPTIPDHRE